MAAPKLTDTELREAALAARLDGADTIPKLRKRTGASEGRLRRVLGEDAAPAGTEKTPTDWERVEIGADVVLMLAGSWADRCKGHEDGSTCRGAYDECTPRAKSELLAYARHKPKAAKWLAGVTMPGGVGGIVVAFIPFLRSVGANHVAPGLRRRQEAANVEGWETPEELEQRAEEQRAEEQAAGTDVPPAGRAPDAPPYRDAAVPSGRPRTV